MNFSINEQKPITLWLSACLLCLPAFVMLFNVYDEQPDYSHGILVIPIAFFVLIKNKAFTSIYEKQSLTLCILSAAAGVFAMIMGFWYETALRPGGFGTEFIVATGCLLILVSLLAQRYSVKNLIQFWWFPLLYLVFAVPVPDSFMLKFTLPLRTFVSLISSHSLDLLGYNVAQQGNVVQVNDLSLGIADACSGIRSIGALSASLIAVDYFLGASFKRLILLALISIPLAVIQNVIRVIITAVFIMHIDEGFSHGIKHKSIGAFTFMLVAVLALIFINKIEWGKRKTFPVTQQKHSIKLPSIYLIILFSVGIISQIIIFSHYSQQMKHPQTLGSELYKLPEKLAGYTFVHSQPIEERSLNILQPTDFHTAVYQNQYGDQIELMVFYWDPQIMGSFGNTHRPHSPEICMPNAGWEAIDENVKPFQDPTLKNIKGFMRSYQQAEQKRLVLFWESTTPGEKYEEEFPNPLNARFKALLESWDKAELILPPQYSVSIAPLTQDLKLASLIAEQFAHDLSPTLVAVGIQNN